MKTSTRRLFHLCVFVLAALLGSLLVFHVWITAKAWDASPASRPAIVAVLRAQAWSKLSGGYWDSEMYNQQQFVAGLPLQDRLEYYRALILQCDLGTSRGLVFINTVGNDAEALYKNLIDFRATAKYNHLSVEQKKAIDTWTNEMDVTAQQRKANPSIKPE